MNDYDCIEDEVIAELRIAIRAINARLSEGGLSDAEKDLLRLERRGLGEDLAALRRSIE